MTCVGTGAGVSDIFPFASAIVLVFKVCEFGFG